jgi:ribonuclease HII
MSPNLSEEKKFWGKGIKRVAGLDEAGRGALCGPVVAAAVMLKSKSKKQKAKISFRGIRDSKKLSPKKREEFYKILTKNPAIEWGIGKVSEKVIDKINILEATKLAMIKAVKNLEKKIKRKQSSYIFDDRQKCTTIDFLIIDGNFKINLKIPQKLIVKADEKVFSCAASSIIAKVTRDRMMRRYAKKFLRYGFEKHKGYPTKFHFKMLKKYGPCKIHRKSFGPVRACNRK